MTTTNDGGPAFPRAACDNSDDGIIWDEGDVGMTLRDYFAAKAMQAMVSCYRNCERGDTDESGLDMHTPARELLIDKNGVNGENEGANEVAADAYVIADAMLAERAKKGGAT